MPLTAGAKAALEAVTATAAPFDQLTIEQARAGLAATLARLAAPAEEVGQVEDLDVPVGSRSVRVRVYRPVRSGSHPLLVYLHGGGWALGDLETHDGVVRALCNAAPAVVVAVDYRRAPEHRFPAALEDAFACLAWSAENARALGARATRIVVGGDSAGGNLTASLALVARDRRAAPIAGQLLVYPVLDARCDTPSYRENASGYFLTLEKMRWFWKMYLPEGEDGSDPYASPLRATDLSGLPPALVITAEYDPLRDEGERYAAGLRAAGIQATCKRYDGQIHAFFSMGGVIPEARDVIERAAEFVANAGR
jgi:acetyl esterase